MDIHNYRILLIGPQHVGKTTIASVLSEKLQSPFFDSDDIIIDIFRNSSKVAQIDQSINDTPLTVREVYKKIGKEQFQILESRALSMLPLPCICATGGGLADNIHAWDTIITYSPKILLTSSVSEVWERIISNGMPAYLSTKKIAHMSQKEIKEAQLSFETLFFRRMEIYKSHADIEIDTQGKAPLVIVEEILLKL